MNPDMRHTLDERRQLIEDRAATLADTAIHDREPWITGLGEAPSDPKRATAWHLQVRIAAAYRSRYGITSPTPLGAPTEGTAQKIDVARARTALDRARQLSRHSAPQLYEPGHRSVVRTGPSL